MLRVCVNGIPQIAFRRRKVPLLFVKIINVQNQKMNYHCIMDRNSGFSSPLYREDITISS